MLDTALRAKVLEMNNFRFCCFAVQDIFTDIKRGRTSPQNVLHHKMYKTKLVYCCDVVPNLVVEIENFNFCLFVCTSHFANFARGKWSNHDSKKCSEIRTVTCLVIWLWKLKISIFVCLFVYLFVFQWMGPLLARFSKSVLSPYRRKQKSQISLIPLPW